MAEVLKVRELRKRFGANQIIRGLDLTIQAGERHAVIGPNGAGKSTLFNLVTGYLRPDGGEIMLKGCSIGGLPPHQVSRAGLSRSFQITTVFAQLSVFENLRIAAMARHNTRFPLFRLAHRAKAINRDAEDLLEQVRLTSVADRLAGGLTYAEQRALEIGMALGPGSDLILLDEPTAGMSREETNYIISLIRTLSAGKTLIVIEHDMDVVFKLCDRISVLVYGEIIASDAPEAIRANDKVQQAYLGEAHA